MITLAGVIKVFARVTLGDVLQDLPQEQLHGDGVFTLTLNALVRDLNFAAFCVNAFAVYNTPNGVLVTVAETLFDKDTMRMR